MRTDRTESEYAELREIVLETKKIAEETRKYSLTTRNYIRWLQLTSILRLLVLVIPIIIALIYLPTVIEKLGGLYSEFFGGTEQGNILQQFLKISELNPEVLQKNVR